MARRPTPEAIENAILIQSRRRCCLCFWLRGTDEVMKGQIAHLDQDPSNCDPDNLTFLCLEHHDEYDGKTSQSKGLKLAEVKHFRDELYREIQLRMRSIPGPLTIVYDEHRHRYSLNEVCETYRFSVRNDGPTTVRNVIARISEIISIGPLSGDDEKSFRALTGSRLTLAVGADGDYGHPQELPAVSTDIHPADEATFDLARLCALPGNSLICSSNFIPHHGSLLRTHGNFMAGKHELEIAVQGEDLSPIRARFELHSTARSVHCRSLSLNER